MKTMYFIVWVLPIIYMLHDFEEIIMVEAWGKRYHDALNKTFPKKQPFGLNYMHSHRTATLSTGIYALYTFFVIVSFCSALLNRYFLWYSAMLVITIHFILPHVILSIKFKHYVPGLITAILFLIPGIYYLNAARILLHYNIPTLLMACITGLILMFILLPLSHKSLKSISLWLMHYAKEK